MAGAQGSLFIREFRIALFFSENHVQVVVFSLPMLFMLPGFYFLEGLSHLADADRRRGEDQECEYADARYSVEEHDYILQCDRVTLSHLRRNGDSFSRRDAALYNIPSSGQTPGISASLHSAILSGGRGLFRVRRWRVRLR